MIDETISRIEEQLRQTASAQPEARAELLKLLGTLKQEVGELSQTHAEQAQSIAGFAAVATHEATREAQNPALRDLSVQGLASTVAGIEESHPRLVQIVNSICTTLSNLGI